MLELDREADNDVPLTAKGDTKAGKAAGEDAGVKEEVVVGCRNGEVIVEAEEG